MPVSCDLPAGWTPPISAVASTRHSSFFGALLDAVRGRDERGDGQALSAVQLDALTRLFAWAYRLPEEAVAAELAEVRIYVGGAAADRGGQTVTLGSDIYVVDAARVAFIMSWQGRRLLAHELGHVMQCLLVPEREAAALGGGKLGRVRGTALNYAVAVAGPALVRGIGKWLADRAQPERRSRRRSIVDDVHDFHPLEIDAERHARAFVALTTPQPSS